jgi:hypothetical protein
MSYSMIARTYVSGWLVAIVGALIVYHCFSVSTATCLYAFGVTVQFAGVVTTIAGLTACLLAFRAALRNLAVLEDGSWFRLVLVLGVYTLTLAGMLVYLFFRPDATRPSGRTTPA